MEPSNTPSPPETKGHVLIVEDDRGLLELYTEVLLNDGYDVAAALDGQAALRALEDGGFDVVLTDVVMPGATGVDILRAVRDRDLDVPVILVTGVPSVETAVQAIDLGALHYLVKPVAREDLLQSVAHGTRLRKLASVKREALQFLGHAHGFMGDRAGLESAFGRAMETLFMAYQPIMRASDGSVFGWEALLRTEESSIASPLVFLEMAERLGRLRDLGRAIRASVGRTAGRHRGVMFFVNLHPDDLLDEALYDPAAPLSVLAPEIVLEITERSPFDAVPDVRHRVQRLRDLGFRLAVDDLGSGYAGLTSFASLQPDFVKLDRGLIRQIDSEPVKRKFVSSIVNLSLELGIAVVAEGIETPTERDVLRELGCSLMQGYFFRRPAELRDSGRFELVPPNAPAAEIPEGVSRDRAPVVRDSPRILIVQDDPSYVERIERELEAGGLSLTLRVVEDRDAYVAALEAERPDLVLSDLVRPGFDGLSALRLLLERWPDVPFIIVTESTDEKTTVECLKAGAVDSVVKDQLSRLVPAVRSALERRLLVEVGREAERLTAEAQAQAQATIDALTSHICVIDETGTIVAVNRAWRVFAAAQAGPPSQVLEGANYIAVCDRASGDGAAEARAFGEGLRELLAGRREEVDLEYHCPTPEGDQWFLARATSFRTQGVRHVVVSHENVSSRKQQEEVLLQTEQQLMMAQKMEAIGRLAGGVAHDFNNILSVIRGQTERMLREVRPDDPTHQRLDQILWSADRASRLTRQLLAFSRQQVLEPRVLPLDAVVADAREMLVRSIGEDIELVVATPDELGHVKADPGQIGQVLLNLAVNARDAMPRGGRLIIELADVVLDEAYATVHPPCVPGPYVLMAVTDTGCGMSENTQSRVFEPFFTTKPEGQGTGLGLATVYGIVKQSGGFIWVYSEPGHGTTFKVYLPRVDEAVEVPAGPAPAAVSHPPHGEACLLVVEDDASVRSLMAEVLTDGGYTVETAGTPAEALALVETTLEVIDLLLTDVIMPGMNGQTLATRVAAFRPEVRVLYVSGYPGEAVVRQGGLARDDHFLQKPFSEEDLLRSVAEALQGPVYGQA